MGKGYMVWFHNNPTCEEAILQRQQYDAVLTGYGENALNLIQGFGRKWIMGDDGRDGGYRIEKTKW